MRYIYKLYVPFEKGWALAMSTASSYDCLDKYRRLQEQGHKEIVVEFVEIKEVA